MLSYRLPREPSAGRVFVWRKLRRLGAILLHDAIWVLPVTPQTREQFRWLVTEIEELAGEATLAEGRLTLDGQDDRLVDAFRAQAEGGYQDILKELKKEDADLAALSRKYQQVAAQDYFRIELGRRVREALVKAAGGSRS